MRGEINTLFLINTNEISILKGHDGRYHYFYKIINNINDNYYYGIHTTDNLDDKYLGSGSRLDVAYKTYGIDNFTKYILRFFDSRKDLLKYEKYIINEELCNDNKCYNIVCGGCGDDSLYITVKDTNGNYVKVSRTEYANNSNKYLHHSKGRVVINNGSIHKYVFPKDLDKYLSEGWVKGEIIHSTKNRIVITKENKEKFIYENELEEYILKGWKKGGKCRNKNSISRVKNFIWVTNDKKQIRIPKYDLNKYILNGWKLGICQKTTKGYIKLTNGIENVSIDPNNIEEINYYISNNWNYGITRSIKPRIWINDTKNSKLIVKDDLDKYLSEGWVKGRLKKDMPKHKDNIILVSKNGKAKQIVKDDLDKYLSEGWVKGNCNINPITNTGKIVISKDGNNKFIYPDDLDKYLSEGWVKGKCKKIHQN